MTRKNLMIDGALMRAQDDLYELYYVYLAEHPDLAERVKDMMYDINDCRASLQEFQNDCWDSNPKQFRSIAELPDLVLQARKDTKAGGEHCRGYLSALARLGHG